MSPTQARHGTSSQFTVEQANRMLPLVRAIAADIQAQREVVEGLTQRLKRLTAAGDAKKREADAAYGDEIREFRRELDVEKAKLVEFQHELRRLGLHEREPSGHCDFPATIDGHDAELCWMLGEPEVLYWHEVEEGFKARKPLVAEAGAESGDVDQGWSGKIG